MSNTVSKTTGRQHAHHFESAEHEFLTSKFGVWLFLATEIMMFGGVLAAYAIFHNIYPEVFLAGSKFLSWQYGATNTIVLLFSSLTMALSIHFLQKDNRKAAIWSLCITLVCGLIFMGIKYIEYSHKFELGLYPGGFFAGDTMGFENLALYFSFYYTMTGLHGVHVIIGMGCITWVLIRTIRGEFGPRYFTPVEGVGLFWHLIDLIWIYLFPLLYLVE